MFQDQWSASKKEIEELEDDDEIEDISIGQKMNNLKKSHHLIKNSAADLPMSPI